MKRTRRCISIPVSGLTLLLDGIPYNETDGEALPEDFDLQAVKGAEVYRGANALRYGSSTLGGAINLLARTGCDADRLGARFEAGSFGLPRRQTTRLCSKKPLSWIFVRLMETTGWKH